MTPKKTLKKTYMHPDAKEIRDFMLQLGVDSRLADRDWEQLLRFIDAAISHAVAKEKGQQG